jgi:putative flippase GtrA
MTRWMKFNRAIGIALQVGVLALLRSVVNLNYFASTAFAVEAGVARNFLNTKL